MLARPTMLPGCLPGSGKPSPRQTTHWSTPPSPEFPAGGLATGSVAASVAGCHPACLPACMHARPARPHACCCCPRHVSATLHSATAGTCQRMWTWWWSRQALLRCAAALSTRCAAAGVLSETRDTWPPVMPHIHGGTLPFAAPACRWSRPAPLPPPLQFNVNDNVDGSPGSGMRLAHERLLRKLLQYRNRPAVLELVFYRYPAPDFTL